MEKLIDRYCEVWGEPDAAKRAAMLAEVWACSRNGRAILRRGIDIAELSSDGRIRRMMGFFL